MTETLATHGLLTRRELAARMGWSEATVGNYVKYHGMPVIKVAGTRLYDLAVVAEWFRGFMK